MKSHVIVILLSLFLLMQMPAKAQTLHLSQCDYSSATCSFSLQEFDMNTQVIDGSAFTTLSFEGSASSNQLGSPDLPLYTRIVEIPVCADVTVEVSDVRWVDAGVCTHPVMPVQPAPSKSQREQIPFVMDSLLYATNAFYAQPQASIEPIGIARDRNLALLRIAPFSYNPVTGQLKQISSMSIQLKYKGANASATQRLNTLHASPAFGIGNNALCAVPATKAVRRSAPVHYLIVAHNSFQGMLDTLVNWKRSLGYIVTLAYTGSPEVGTTNTEIASYIKNYYTNATAELPAPTYLLLVGDHDQIPAFGSRVTDPSNTHVTDLYFATWTEGDHLPDCYYGRFSARNASELTPQVEKTIYYESYSFADDSYLGHGVLIAGEDRGSVGDNAYRYADPTMDYIASTYINAGNNYHTVHYYKNNVSFAPTGVVVSGSSQTTNTANILHQLYNGGCGLVNYSAHGYDDSWSSPSFTTDDVARMTNNNRPSFMIGNCCLSGKFNTTTYDGCLGEALLRKEGNAGAVAYIGCTNSSYWPDDFCWSVGVRTNINNTMNATYDSLHLGVYDRLFHTHNEDFAAWHHTTGSILTAGNMAVEASGSSRAYYYWEIYELFGDPSLMPWLGQASDMNVVAPSSATFESLTYTVTAPPHAYVALIDPETMELLAAAYANDSGSAVLNLPSDITVGTYNLAVTAQNYKPYFQEVVFIVSNASYILVSDFQPTSGNLVPGQPTTFDITLQNVGTQYPSQGLITLQCEDAGVTIAQPLVHFEAIAPGDSLRLTGLWLTYVPENCADQSRITFTTEVSFGDGTSIKRNRLFTAAPVLRLAEVRTDSAITSGASNTIHCRIVNSGHATSPALSLSLPNLFGFMTAQPAVQPLDTLAPGQSAQVSFPVSMAADLPTSSLRFALQGTDGQDTFTVGSFLLPSGFSSLEDFESGDFTSFNWSVNTYPWDITDVDPFDGRFSARSNENLPRSSESRLAITWTSSVDDSISFYYKVSSEQGYDKFRFLMDDAELLSASGEEGWSRAAFPVNAGTHSFAFSYSKDYSRTQGSDCAWVDNVQLPFAGTPVTYLVDTVCQNGVYMFGDELVSTEQPGHVTLSDSNVYLSLNVVPQPDVHIEVIGQPELGGCILLKATGANSYVWSTGDSAACIAVCPEEGSHYSVTGCRAGCCNTDQLTLLGIDQIQQNGTAMLYPNPATTTVTVEAENMRSVRLVNLMGQTVADLVLHTSRLDIPLQNLPRGIYFVRVETAETVSTHKLVVK
ncbi:MAG: T9SS type A sorting domain-containing protein [Bacteroidales bacterium]|nr:T9SS type A sorting domain-containing protein [Bacteroidales bacterium]